MPYNVNTKSISDYFHWITHENTIDEHHRDEIDVLLFCALKRPLARELSNQAAPRNLIRITAPSPSDPDWVHKAFNANTPVYDFWPGREMATKIGHVFDWLHAASAHDEPWIKQTDQLGRPLKLLKLGSVDQAVAEADKAMRRGTQNPAEALGPDHLETVKTFPDGASIVKLLTMRALDAESHAMGHCVGLGAYDTKLMERSHSFYSLRCAAGKAHATMEVREADNALLQCQGKENATPVPKYMPYIREFAQDRQFVLDENLLLPIIKQSGIYYDPENLPENFRWEGDLDLSNTNVNRLPDGFTVTGSLCLATTNIRELPPRFSVGKDLDLCASDIERLPDDLHVPGRLTLDSTSLKTLPRNLRAGSLDLENTPIEQLPRDITIERDLILRCSAVRELPPSLLVPGDLELTFSRVRQIPPDIKIGGSLYIGLCDIETLPENLHIPGKLDAADSKLSRLPGGLRVGGTLFLDRCRVNELPPDLQIGKALSLRDCHFKSLPEGLRVPGDLVIAGTRIDTFPKSMTIAGDIFVDHDTRLPEIPAYFSGRLYSDGSHRSRVSPSEITPAPGYARHAARPDPAPAPERLGPGPDIDF